MDIHKPKPVHGWREFLKEYGIIVLGVLTALAGEQTVEAMHHRAQAHEMTEKLRAESDENAGVIALDAESARALEAAADRQIRLLSSSNPDPDAIGLPDRFALLQPADSAWMSIRDSALMPIMPPLLISNYWKIDATDEGVRLQMKGTGDAVLAAKSALAVLKLRPHDEAVRREALLRLSDLRQHAAALLTVLDFFGRMNEQVLKNERLTPAFARRVIAGADRGHP